MQFVAAVAGAAGSFTAAADVAAQETWDREPYRIHALLAIDVPGGLAEQVAKEMPSYLKERVDAAIGPAWSWTLEIPAGAARHRVFADILSPIDAEYPSGIESATGARAAESRVSREPPEFPADRDKLLLLTVRSTPLGYEIAAREFDRYLQRWGPAMQRVCRQNAVLPEQLFWLTWRAVSPLVQVELDPDDEHSVNLHPRGAALPRRSDEVRWAMPGDVFLPYLRRTTREGELVPNGIQQVPWTFIETVDAEGGLVAGRIQSGARRPFGVRQRGRIEQLAIALRFDPNSTQVRLHARTDPKKPLIGYEAFVQNTNEEEVTSIGHSDQEGRIAVGPGHSRVQLLFIKNGGHIPARLPVVPGGFERIDVPLPDYGAGLQAEARLAALREELIDVVARRNILIARARLKIEEGELSEARELIGNLDRLPGRSQFNQLIQNESRLHRSDDPQVQRLIDQQFTITRTVLSQFLDPGPVNDLNDQLREAQREGA